MRHLLEIQRTLCYPALVAIFMCIAPYTQALPPAGTSPADCAGCHKNESELWRSSHHAQSMAAATVLAADGSRSIAAEVLGDFNAAQTKHFELQGDFRTVDGHPVMSLKRDNTTTHHVVTYSFGVTPLQQYLTETSDGHQQILPFSWDTRPKAEGGQRWLTLRPTEDVQPADRLHWQQPLANWNGMCADCHSSNLVRNYSPTKASFETTFSDVNVACASCHSSDPHNKNPIAKGSAAGFTPRYPLVDQGKIAGSTVTGSSVAGLTASAAEHQSTLEICAGCHSLRSPLVDGFDPTQPFLDQFTPTLPNPPLYFPDGQIREEVYVWGSFLQSRMHEEGVTCGNCHDPHSQKLKAAGNELCSQCHLATTYDSATHHKHEQQSPGAQCKNCHMPSRTYMVVDDRHDHSFRVPNPAASAALGAPDVCTSCHQGKNQTWAATTLSDWSKTKTNQRVSNQPVPEIVRAAAVSQQAMLQSKSSIAQLSELLTSEDPLVVLAAASTASRLPLATRQNLLGPLLKHRYRAIRIAAANELRDAKVEPETPLARALAQADTADRISSWRGEGAMNTALNAERGGDAASAIEGYRRAIEIEPYFEPSYINLTELYRREGDTRREQLLYKQGLRALPESPLLRYSYALHLVRRKNSAQAVLQTAMALEIDPSHPSNAYLHLLLLDNLGKTSEGIAWLRSNLKHHQDSPQVLQIGIQQAQKIGDADSAALFGRLLSQMSRN